MSNFAGANLLITGGAQGMGRLVAELAAERGAARVVLWDIREDLLQVTRGELAQRFSRTEFVATFVDISNTAALREAASAAGRVDILLNNAGVVTGKPFAEHTHDDITRTMDINSAAPMHLALALLPQMLARRDGHIVNISSAASLVANPRMSVYCASKWAVTGWSESLLLEMREGRTGVRVTTIMPYYVRTGMFEGVRSSPLLPLMTPASAAARIVRAIERNEARVRMPWQIYALPFLKGVLPARAFDLVIGRWLGVYDTMQEFRGRTP